MSAQQLDQVGNGHAEDRAREVVVEGRDERGDEAAQRQSVQPDRHPGLPAPDPAQHRTDVRHRLRGRVDVVEHVLPREHRAPRQAFRAGSVHGQHGKNDIETELIVQLPSPEQREIDCSAPHLGAVDTHQPWPWHRMAQQQAVAVCTGPIPEPPGGTGLTRSWPVIAHPPQPFVRAVAALHRMHLDVGEPARRGEEAARIIQQAAAIVKVKSSNDFRIDARERRRITHRAARPQAEKHHLVAQRFGGERERRPGNRNLVRCRSEVVAPRPRVIATGPGQRPQGGAQRRGGFHTRDANGADEPLQEALVTGGSGTTTPECRRCHGRTTVTGTSTDCATVELTDPSSMPAKPPRPWLPTTTSCARCDSTINHPAGASYSSRRRTRTSG